MKPNRRKLIKISLLFIGIVSTIVGWICTESNIFPLGLILLIGGGFLTLFLGKWMIDDWSYSPNHNKKWAKDWSEYTKKGKILLVIFIVICLAIIIILGWMIRDFV